MKLKDCVSEIFLGLNKSNKRININDKTIDYKELTIKSVNNKFINENELDIYNSLTKIDAKFLTKKDDIIVCSKQPYNVVLIEEENANILVNSNFIILRSINIDKTFLYNYLNLLGSKMKNDITIENKNITKADIEDIDIKISETKMEKISKICKKINNRQKAYGTLLDNDQQLIKIIYEKGMKDRE